MSELINLLEDAIIEELDRQFNAGEIDDGTTDGAYFDTADGEVIGIPDWWLVAKKVLDTYVNEWGE